MKWLGVLAVVVFQSTAMAQRDDNLLPSRGMFYTLRLGPKADLKKELLRLAHAHGLKAASIVTCVGSLEHVALRFANQEVTTTRAGHFEIVSLTGTLTSEACHLHLAVSDSVGTTTGGHVMDGNLVYTTAEITLVEQAEAVFERKVDTTYGYRELVVKPRKRKR
ncbi:MAG: DNA-binding protein [Cyclobacteriaceae bacterium]|jgi:hypothetical protein|nr:DNA-binding protein [Cyclobacteriaceae bacterium]